MRLLRNTTYIYDEITKKIFIKVEMDFPLQKNNEYSKIGFAIMLN